MLLAQAGEITLGVYKAVQDEDGNWDLGEKLAETSTKFKVANMESITYAMFSDLLYTDPETGLEETLVIDDAVFVLVTCPMQNYPLEFYHDEPLPSERHAFNLINYTIEGEEYTMLDDVNFRFTYTDGSQSYVSAFAFNYYIMMYYMHNNEDTDTFNAPVEGGEKTFSIDSYYSSQAWDVTDTEYLDLPDWISVEFEDGTVESDGEIYYNGVTDAKIIVEPLPEGVESRSIDVMLSYEGAKLIIHVNQPEPQEPVEYNEFYLVGTFNEWNVAEDGGRLAFAKNEEGVLETTVDLEADAEFKIITPDANGSQGYKWFGGIDEAGVGYFLITSELLNEPLEMLDGSNFKMEEAGNYTLRLAGTPGETGLFEPLSLVVIKNVALFGDVNCDGSVNAADVTALYNYILNGDETYLATSDVNGDGAVNAGDVTAVYNVILGTTLE